MQRREFITLFGGATATWSLTARAQQSAAPIVSLLSSELPELDAFRVAAFTPIMIFNQSIELNNARKASLSGGH